MTDKFMNPQQRANQYQYSDGLFELNTGFDYLIFTAYLYATSFLISNHSSLIIEIISIGLCLLIYIGGQTLFDLIIRRIKDQVIFPRSGNVSYHGKAIRSWQEIMAGLMTFAVLVLVGIFILTKNPGAAQWLPALTGLFIAIRLNISTFRSRLVRFYLLGAMSILVGTILSLAPIGWEQGVLFCLVTMSTIYVISGSLAFWIYLRRTHSPHADNPADS
jgi:hypothetical protein